MTKPAWLDQLPRQGRGSQRQREVLALFGIAESHGVTYLSPSQLRAGLVSSEMHWHPKDLINTLAALIKNGTIYRVEHGVYSLVCNG